MFLSKIHLEYGASPLAQLLSLWQLMTLVSITSTKKMQTIFSALKDKYSITIDWSGDSYLGITIYWKYENSYVDISMPDYVAKA